MSSFSNLTIVVLGASFGGISCVNHLYNQALKELRLADPTFTYRIILISPSDYLYWNIAAPRAIISSNLIPHSQKLTAIAPGFEKYDSSIFEFVIGTVTKVNTRAATVTVLLESDDATRAAASRKSIDGKRLSYVSGASSRTEHTKTMGTVERHVKYHSLIIATGTTSHSNLFSLRGPHIDTGKALEDIHARLPRAETVVIAGGGATGVEVAGQIAYYYNVRGCIRSTSIKKTGRTCMPLTRKRVILYSSSSQLLPDLDPKQGTRAKAQLESLGVEVQTGIRVTRTDHSDATGFTTLSLTQNLDKPGNLGRPSVDRTMITDLYIPCTGVSPNTSFLPDALLDMNGYIRTTRDRDGHSTLRVPLPDHLMPRSARPRSRDSASIATMESPLGKRGSKRLSTFSMLSTEGESHSRNQSIELQRHNSIIPGSPFAINFSQTSQSGPTIPTPLITDLQPPTQVQAPQSTSPTITTTPFSPFSFVAPTTASLLGPPDTARTTPPSATNATIGSLPEGTKPTDPILALHPRIYALGDVADYSANCIQDVYAAMPVLEQNFIVDHLAWQLRVASGVALDDDLSEGNQPSVTATTRENEARASLRADLRGLADASMSYRRDTRISMLVPIGGHMPFPNRLPEILARPRWFLGALLKRHWRPGGVGVLMDRSVPGFVVWLLKGRTYMVDQAVKVVRQGVSPYPYQEGERRASAAGGGKAGLG